MADHQHTFKIKVTENGPYLVTGNIPLLEKVIVPKGNGYVFKNGRPLPQSERYLLCRCGKSKNQPFCDGSHEQAKFNKREIASRDLFSERAERIAGPALDLLDDGRCAYARFCHREEGTAWNLVLRSDDPTCRAEAIIAATECPAGRLEVYAKDGQLIEPSLEPVVEILQDPEEEVSGPIYVKGGIPIESADGYTYEIRNRVTLCRCGKSKNMPFCDAAHIAVSFTDRSVRYSTETQEKE